MSDTARMILAEKGNLVHKMTPNTSIGTCIDKMNANGIGAVVVVDENDKLVGMFSERDVLRKVVNTGCDFVNTPISRFMTKEVVTGTLDTKIEEAMSIFTEHRFRHLPIVQNGVLQGLISIGDVTRWLIIGKQSEIDNLTDYVHGQNYN